MIIIKRYLPRSLNIAFIGLVWALGAGYLLVSYYHAKTAKEQETQSLFINDQKVIIKAIERYLEFLQLTESRLLQSVKRPDWIPHILSLRFDNFVGNPFPEAIDLTFTSFLEPKAEYSLFGKRPQNESPAEIGQDAIAYVGQGEFKIIKSIYSKDRQIIGKLQTTFSIKHLLFAHFSATEIGIYPSKYKPKTDERFFNISALPFQIVLRKRIPSFRQYLWQHRLQLLVSLMLSLSFLLMGFTKALWFNKKYLLKQRTQNQALQKEVLSLNEDKRNLSENLTSTQQIIKLHESSVKGIISLFGEAQRYYRNMANQAHTTHLVTAKLLSSEDNWNRQTLSEIPDLSMEANAILKQLAKGYPMKDAEETINVLECIESIKALFLPVIIERNINVKIKSDTISQPCLDKTIFKLVLCNIFSLTIDRLVNNNTLSVVVRDHDHGLHLNFCDDGYDISDPLQKINATQDDRNILKLDKKSLSEFASQLGWELSFSRTGFVLNTIDLRIPSTPIEQKMPENVINFFDYKA